jgi:hypothetical protein
MWVDTSIVSSILFLCGCSTIMSSFGDAVAWYRMPKYDTTENAQSHILHDLGHELIPYSCELSFIRHNIQTTVIVFSLPVFIIRCCFLHNGNLIFNRFAHLAGMMMLLRTITMVSTAFPNPNPQCMDDAIVEISYHDAVVKTMSSCPTKSCGNLMFSGHTMFLTLFCIFEIRYLQFNNICRILSLAKTILGIYSVVACRSHYTIDVVISLLLTNMVFHLREKHIHKNTGEYFARCDMV